MSHVLLSVAIGVGDGGAAAPLVEQKFATLGQFS